MWIQTAPTGWHSQSLRLRRSQDAAASQPLDTADEADLWRRRHCPGMRGSRAGQWATQACCLATGTMDIPGTRQREGDASHGEGRMGPRPPHPPTLLPPTRRTQGALEAWTLGVQYRLLPCICPTPALVSSETWAHLLGIQSEGGQREAPATVADPHFLSKLPGGSPRSKGRALTGAWAELGG